MIEELEAAGLSFVGRDETGQRMEVCTLKSVAYCFKHADSAYKMVF